MIAIFCINDDECVKIKKVVVLIRYIVKTLPLCFKHMLLWSNLISTYSSSLNQTVHSSVHNYTTPSLSHWLFKTMFCLQYTWKCGC